MWYKVVNGKQQGDRMGKRKKFGHGQYADTMTRFVTIEQNVSAIRKFYDDALKDTHIANPAPTLGSRRCMSVANCTRFSYSCCE